jgi:translation elongation factor EF-G
VNNPEYDALLHLNLEIEYRDTTLLVTIPTKSYSMRVTEEIDDILNIKNTGSETARNIIIRGEWLTDFTFNNFDLAPGQTKNIGYTINPSGILYTNQTNKTYERNITVSGNFETIKEEIDVFIEYATLENGSVQSQSIESLVEIYWEVIQAYCSDDDNSQEEICLSVSSQTFEEFSEFQRNASSSDLAKSINELGKGVASFIDEQDKKDKIDNIWKSNVEKNITSVRQDNNVTAFEIQEIKDILSGLRGDVLWSSAAVLFLILIGALGFVAIKIKRKKDMSEMEDLM